MYFTSQNHRLYIYIYIDSNMFVRSKVGEESKQRRRGVPQSTLQVHTEAAAGAHLCLVMIGGLHRMLAVRTIPRKKKLVLFYFIYLFVDTKRLVFIFFIFIFGR
jgi:hypothetical protein